MTYSTLRDVRATEAITSDLLPECPRCRELNDPGATTCGDCGAHLLVAALLRRRPQAASPEEVFVCPNCIRECVEPWCDGCGRRLK